MQLTLVKSSLIDGTPSPCYICQNEWHEDRNYCHYSERKL